MVELYVGERLVAWARVGGTEIFDDAAGWVPALERCLKEVVRQQQRFSRSSATVWLSGALARPFLVEPVAGLKSFEEAQAVATSAAAAATGLEGPCAVQLEGMPTHQPTLATAVGQALVDQLLAALKQHGTGLVSLRPWWCRAMNHQLQRIPDTALICVNEPGVATLLGASGTVPTVATTLVPRPEPDQTLAMMRRLCMGHGMPADRAATGELDVMRFHENVDGMHWSLLQEPSA
jgi:hypothetical protein